MAQDLANAIAQMEGFNVQGSIAQRYNNPGNLRYAPTQSGSVNTASGTFATFATPEDGWNALYSYLQTQSNNGLTLRQLVYKYAPPTENDTSNYLNYVSGQLGVGADTNLSDILTTGGGSGGGGIVDSSWDSSSGISLDGSNTSGIDETTIAMIGIGIVAIAVVAMS